MSTQITVSFVEQFKNQVITLSQQKGSRLRGTVMMESVTGKSAYFERVGEVSMVIATSRHDDTPQIDTPHSRRKVALATYRWADLIDDADRVRLLIDPQSPYATVGMYAAGRTMDSTIIAAAIGNAYSGEAGATTVALPSAQKIASASAGLTVAKLIAAKEILDEGDVDPDQPRVIVTRPDGITDLLSSTQVTSADYNSVKALVAGQIDTFMGFKFISTNLAPSGKAVAWTKMAMALAVGAEPVVRISERPDKNYSTQVFIQMDIGSTRVEDEGVVEISYV
jgi:hypothetical protein